MKKKKKKKLLAVTVPWAHLGAAESMSVQHFSCCSCSPKHFFSYYLRKSPLQHTTVWVSWFFFSSSHMPYLVQLWCAKCCRTGYFPRYHSRWSRHIVSHETIKQCSVMEEVQDSWSQMTRDWVLAQPFTNHITLISLNLNFLSFQMGIISNILGSQNCNKNYKIK